MTLRLAASGSRVISIAARHADRIDLMLGASAKRIQWGMEVAREARRKEGVAGDVPLSAYVNLIVHDDGELAWKMAGPAITSQGRFAAMHSKVVGPVSDESRQIPRGPRRDRVSGPRIRFCRVRYFRLGCMRGGLHVERRRLAACVWRCCRVSKRRERDPLSLTLHGSLMELWSNLVYG